MFLVLPLLLLPLLLPVLALAHGDATPLVETLDRSGHTDVWRLTCPSGTERLSVRVCPLPHAGLPVDQPWQWTVVLPDSGRAVVKVSRDHDRCLFQGVRYGPVGTADGGVALLLITRLQRGRGWRYSVTTACSAYDQVRVPHFAHRMTQDE